MAGGKGEWKAITEEVHTRFNNNKGTIKNKTFFY